MTTETTEAARLFKGTDTDGRSEAELRQLVRHAGAELELAPAEVIIEWAVATFGKRFAITSSMADGVLAHLASTVAPGVDVVFLDTGYHFAETIGTRDAVQATLPVNVINVTAEQSVAEQDATYGKDLFARDPDLCCKLRKVKPLEDALSGYDAWATGLRRDETHNRVIAPVIGWDEAKAQGQGVAARPLDRRRGRPLRRREQRAGQPAALRRLPVDRLLAVHASCRRRRGPAQRPLGRHRQDRVRDPRMTHSTPSSTASSGLHLTPKGGHP